MAFRYRRYRRRFRRRFTRGRYRRRRFRRKQTRGAVTRVPRAAPMGRAYKTVMRYCEFNVALDPASLGVPGQYVYSANGIYDPNITGAGHQPLGFDQLMLVYDHYVVIGSKLTVRLQNTDGSRNAMVILQLQDNPTVNTDLENVIENGTCTYRMLGPATSGTDTALLKMSCNPAKFLGRSKPMSDSDLRGSSSSNPTEQAYFVLSAQASDETDTAQVFAVVTLEYVTVFTEPKQLAGS